MLEASLAKRTNLPVSFSLCWELIPDISGTKELVALVNIDKSEKGCGIRPCSSERDKTIQGDWVVLQLHRPAHRHLLTDLF
jgi:hypothetical protein